MSNLIAGYLVMGLAAMLFLISFRIRKSPTFPLVLLNRWLRWVLFGLGMAYVLREWGVSGRPFWSLAPTFMLLWILVESIYAWLAVRALSLSNLPVFPSYRAASGDVNWPVEDSYLKVKEEIRSEGFTLQEKLSAKLGEHMTLQSLLYTDESKQIRLQVIFAPRSTGRPALFFIFTSKVGEQRWATDNVWLPFGGVFPAHWSVDRRPFISSPRTLLQRHRRKLSKSGVEPELFEEDLVDELNDEQEVLDRVSTEHGILVPRGQRPEFGKLTGDGRYRVWKQILLLNYFGKAGRKDVR
ncbi:hypothetical protein [Puniceicoccus vermicola]|uniref:Uncharacterized protein n=1 Tax=Puniceicoccus vermicola TaxID=388746 RepID=A0A7X1E3Y0_9BACT|nr:hypothetical protein [Puniceicoccus vermicola]MBC2601413.1 hypothetical protein [Puniceicoccus vermicola]